jgi:hypothetical protein
MSQVLETDIGPLLTSKAHLHSLGTGDVLVVGGRVATVASAVLGRGVVAYTLKFGRGFDTKLGGQNDMVDRVTGGR